MNGLKFASQAHTLVEVLRERAERHPERRAFTFLSDDGREAGHLTFGMLDQRARTVAAVLQSFNAGGARALVVFPAGLDFVVSFFGCLYAGTVAVPTPAPAPTRLARTLPRLSAIIRDAQAEYVLTTSAILTAVRDMFGELPDLRTVRWIATDVDMYSAGLAEDWIAPGSAPEDLAYLQYSSGSTGSPKGVMVSHRNVMHHSTYVAEGWRYADDSRSVTWMPNFHDYGLIEGIIQPVFGGFPGVLMSPLAFVQEPIRWLRAISTYRATNSAGPNFAYDLCVRKITPEMCDGLDLSSWRVAGNAAETIRADTLDRFVATFADFGFRRETFFPAYGLAEATLVVTTRRESSSVSVVAADAAILERERRAVVGETRGTTRTIVGCGHPVAGMTVRIVDPETRVGCAEGHIGEIWVADPSVAGGYWNQPEETAATFAAHRADTGEGPFLRTGDLGFFHQGELFVTGRIKDLIIIRGRNYSPQDIEWTVEHAHSAVRPGCSAAFAVEVDGEERLIVAAEVERRRPGSEERRRLTSGPEEGVPPFSSGPVIQAIRKAIAEDHDLRAHGIALLKPGTLPKTSSGKIQRRLTRERYLTDSLDIVGSSIFEHTRELPAGRDLTRATFQALTPAMQHALVEAYLKEHVAHVLRVPPEQIAVAEPIGAMGLDSLLAAELRNRIERDYGLILSVVDFLRDISLSELARDIAHRLVETPTQQLSLNITATLSLPTEEFDTSALLARVDELSDAEVDELLDTSILPRPEE